jgi:putative transposase
MENAGLPPRFWQPRFYDFNVWSAKKVREKLEYMHHNPVKRGLVKKPGDWKWSSFWFYEKGEGGLVAVGPLD